MRIEYDPEADALYIHFREVAVEDNLDIEEGVTVDLDAQGHNSRDRNLGRQRSLHQGGTKQGRHREPAAGASWLLNLSARGFHRVLKLARTIADLAGVEAMAAAHVAEALQYRPRVRIGCPLPT